MQNYYKILGLKEGASQQEVVNAYRDLAQRYNPDNFSDPRQKQEAQRGLEQVNQAFDRIMNYLRRGTVEEEEYSDDRRRFYGYIRGLIQDGRYDTAINQLTAYNNEDEAEWQFLMGSALYYGGYISRSFDYFSRAAAMEPANSEYQSAFGRMSQNRTGNMSSSPFGDIDINATVCGDPCTVLQCLVCINCLRH